MYKDEKCYNREKTLKKRAITADGSFILKKQIELLHYDFFHDCRIRSFYLKQINSAGNILRQG